MFKMSSPLWLQTETHWVWWLNLIACIKDLFDRSHNTSHSTLYPTVSLNADINFLNEPQKRGPNPCLWVHRQCKFMIFKIPHVVHFLLYENLPFSQKFKRKYSIELNFPPFLKRTTWGGFSKSWFCIAYVPINMD